MDLGREPKSTNLQNLYNPNHIINIYIYSQVEISPLIKDTSPCNKQQVTTENYNQ